MKDEIIAKLKEKEKILNKIIKHWQKFVHGDIRVDMWEIGLKQLESILERLESELSALESQEVEGEYKKGFDEGFETARLMRIKELAEYSQQSSKVTDEKEYDIDFDGHCMAGLSIKDNIPTIIGAMNGYGNGISLENIKITIKKSN